MLGPMGNKERPINQHYAFTSLLCFETSASSFNAHPILLAKFSLNTTHWLSLDSEWPQIQRTIFIPAQSILSYRSTCLSICLNPEQRKTMESLSSISLNFEDKWGLLYKISTPLRTDVYTFLEKIMKADQRILKAGRT